MVLALRGLLRPWPGGGLAPLHRLVAEAPRALVELAPRRLCLATAPRRLCSTVTNASRRARSTIAAEIASPRVAVSAASASAGAVVPREVGWWLVGCSSAVFGMVVLGGVTRLTRSGLSMTDWRPQGSLPPLNEAEWEAEFAKYKRFPEFQRLHPDMDLDDFKSIFWYEWSHRMAGRAIGIIFGVPLLYFSARGKIPRHLAPTLGLLFALGGSQGLVGWWMVRSGLQEPPADLDGVPRVSPYRLASHLTVAFGIYSMLLYTSLGILQPRWTKPGAAVFPASRELLASIKPLFRRAHMLAALVGVTAISGAFVAGMQAGFAFNTFPLMEGRLIPDGYFELKPAYRNFFESVRPASATIAAAVAAAAAAASSGLGVISACAAQVPSVQLHHRALALSTVGAIGAFWAYAHRLPLPPAVARTVDVLLLAAIGQVSLGVATVVHAVPVWLGSAHQAGALTLFSVTLLLLHTLRVPHAAARAARFAPQVAARSARDAKLP